MTKITYIPGEIANAAIDEYGNRKPVTRTQHIFDDTLNKPQSQVNEETTEAITNEVTRAQNAESGLDTRLQTVEELAEISISGGDIGIGTAADFESDDPSDLAKVPTVGAMLGGANDGVYDISARHNGTKYADLAAALGTDGINVPVGVRRGGMSVKFIQTYDNKYIQARCMAQNFTIDVTQWQGVDDEPTPYSKNLVKSGGVSKEIDNLKIGIDGVINNRLFITGNTKVYIKMKAGVSYTFTLSIDEAKSFAIYNQLYGNGALIIGLTIQAGNTSYSYTYTPQTDIDDAYVYIPSSISGNYMNVSVVASKSVVQRLDSLDEAVAAEILARTNKDTELSGNITDINQRIDYINGTKYLTGSTTTRYSEKIINIPVYEGDTLEISDFTSQLSIRQISLFGNSSTLLGTSPTGNIKIVVASHYEFIRVVIDYNTNVTSTYSFTFKIHSYNNINGIYDKIESVDNKFDVLREATNFDLVDGYILGTSGALQPSEIFKSTDFIDISDAISKYISFNCVISGSSGFCFYDKNKNAILGVNSTNASSYGITPTDQKQKIKFVIPEYACYFRTCIFKTQDISSTDFEILFYFGRNVVNKECEIIRPFYNVHYPAAFGWSDFIIVNGYLYAFINSADNHSNYSSINIIRLSDMSLVKTLQHNLGHCNTVHYRNGKIIIGNLPGYTDHLSEFYILYDVDNWVNYEDNTKIEYSSATVIDLSNSPIYGGQIAGCFGENNLELDNIVYVSAWFNKSVHRILLGMGTNQLDYGTYTASDNDKYNGTFKILDSYKIVLDTNDDNEEVIQGIDYYNGHILTANGHTGGKAFLWDIRSDNFITRRKILIDPKDENGQLYSSYTEGIAVDDNGAIYQGIFRWNEDVPQKVNCLVSYKL